ncbi:MAG: hypothetical protein ACK5PP_18915 [Acidimicrobiales bacterium]
MGEGVNQAEAAPRRRRAARPGPAGRRIRRLSTDELGRYDVLPAQLADRVWLIRVPEPPGPFVGITLGRFVFVARDIPAHVPSSLLAHELVHVRQWHELGAIGYLWAYLGDFGREVRRHRSWLPAYRDIDAEREARRIAAHWADRQIDDRQARPRDDRPSTTRPPATRPPTTQPGP